MNIFDKFIDLVREPFWSPYLAGFGIGILSWLTFLLSKQALGVSTAFSQTAGMIERKINGPTAAEKPYYREVRPVIDWKWLLVAGLFFGAMTSAWLADAIRWTWVPEMWETAFGPSRLVRVAAALAGGILVGFGARWGCGCTSGHGISGTLQLVISSWLSAACFFIGGIAAAFFIYGAL